uniref:Pao retrotransposon peptidase n=1 Tax=Loa loa TaxID=7209 RepID=A0A1I7VQU1_LOALO
MVFLIALYIPFWTYLKHENKAIPKHDRIEGGATKILGITWINDKDTIRVTLKPWIEHELTKRNQILDKDDKEAWRSLTKEWLADIIEIPRLATKKLSDQQVHVFTDASSVAYSVAVHILNKHTDERNSAILFAKSRLAPIKSMIIPRLKLLAILTGVRAANFVIKQLSMGKIPVVLWSDSKCALHWIQSRSKLLPKFIQNRVEEIRKVNFSFRYVPSEDNPVDIVTKGLSSVKLRQYKLWWEGPSWLTSPESGWLQWEYQSQKNLKRDNESLQRSPLKQSR